VYGRRAAEALTGRAAPHVRAPAQSAPVADVPEHWKRLQECMWANVGLMRSSTKLAAAEQQLEALAEQTEAECVAACSTGTLSFRNALHTAKAIASAAHANTVSVGTHYREDAETLVAHVETVEVHQQQQHSA
jgi:aspartate oxidase